MNKKLLSLISIFALIIVVGAGCDKQEIDCSLPENEEQCVGARTEDSGQQKKSDGTDTFIEVNDDVAYVDYNGANLVDVGDLTITGDTTIAGTSTYEGNLLVDKTGTATVSDTDVPSYKGIFRSSVWDTNDLTADTWDMYLQAEGATGTNTEGQLAMYASKNGAAGTKIVYFDSLKNAYFQNNIAAIGYIAFGNGMYLGTGQSSVEAGWMSYNVGGGVVETKMWPRTANGNLIYTANGNKFLSSGIPNHTTDPHFYVTSGNLFSSAQGEYLDFSHNRTNPYILSGKGDIKMSALDVSDAGVSTAFDYPYSESTVNVVGLTEAGAVTPRGSDVLTDGGLETWASSTALTNWDTIIFANNPTLEQESTIIHSGTYAGKFTNDGGIPPVIEQLNTGLTVGATYNVQYWARYATAGAGKVIVLNDAFATANQIWNFTSSTWDAFTGSEFTSPAYQNAQELTGAYAEYTTSDFTVPANGQLNILVYGQDDDGAGNEVFYIDDIDLATPAVTGSSLSKIAGQFWAKDDGLLNQTYNFAQGILGGYTDSGSSANSVPTVLGASGWNYFNATNTRSVTYDAIGLYGINELGESNANLSIDEATGVFAQAISNTYDSVSSTVTTTIAVNAHIPYKGSGNELSILDNYGIYMGDHSGIGSRNNWAMYSAGGDWYIKDKVGIGTSTPAFDLQVAGGTTTSTMSVGVAGVKAGCIPVQDTDLGGWTYLTTLDGVLTVSTESCL